MLLRIKLSRNALISLSYLYYRDYKIVYLEMVLLQGGRLAKMHSLVAYVKSATFFVHRVEACPRLLIISWTKQFVW